MRVRNQIYDEMCILLTDYEQLRTDAPVRKADLYEMLAKIQRHWEEIISENSQ